MVNSAPGREFTWTYDTPVGEALSLPCLREVADGTESFCQEMGPFVSYRRYNIPGPNGEVRQQVQATLNAPGLAWLFGLVFHRILFHPESKLSKLIPPAPISSASLEVIARIFWLSSAVAFAGTILGQTLAYTAPTIHAGPFAQSGILAGARVDVLFAIPLARAADRISRVKVLTAALVEALIASALCSLATSVWMLAVGQVLTKIGATTALLVLTVIIAETVESSARAWSLAFLVIAAALGTGTCAVMVAFLGLSPLAWRFVYLASLLALPLYFVARKIPDPPRFTATKEHIPMRALASKQHRFRLLLVCTATLMVNIFFIPESQFRNQFLRFDRHFSSLEVSLFTIGTYIPAVIGLAIGARIAETKGRKGIASIGLILGALFYSMSFLSGGVFLIVLAVFGGIAGTSATPALSVFGPELFPTRLRSTANSISTFTSRVGSVIGVLFVGYLASRGWGYGKPIALLGVFPIILAFIVWRYFPETRARSLEDINPEDDPAGYAAPI